MKRSGQVLPFTLTELFVLLFFALALALVWQTTARAEAEKETSEWEPLIADSVVASLGPAGVREVINILHQGEDSIPENFDTLVREVREQGEARRQLQDELKRQGADSMAVDTASLRSLADSVLARQQRAEERNQALQDSMATREAQAAQRIQELKDALERATPDGAALAACMDTLSTAQDQLASIRSERDNARNQAQACYNRLGNGLDHPPCWADADGRPEYAYQTTLHTDSLVVEPVWPAHRASEAANIPGMTALGSGAMNYQAFSQKALPVFAWSTRQTPECRHFVRIVDQTPPAAKAAYKQNLRTVERFFYKLLVN